GGQEFSAVISHHDRHGCAHAVTPTGPGTPVRRGGSDKPMPPTSGVTAASLAVTSCGRARNTATRLDSRYRPDAEGNRSPCRARSSTSVNSGNSAGNSSDCSSDNQGFDTSSASHPVPPRHREPAPRCTSRYYCRSREPSAARDGTGALCGDVSLVNQTRHARAGNRRKLTGGVILAAVLILAALIALAVVYASGEQDSEIASSFDPPADPDARQVTFLDHRRENYQDLTEQQYAQKYQEGDYTLQDPLVIQDPYSTAPLTALVMFHTDEPTSVRVTVAGKDDNSSIARTYESYRTDHRVPVLGLYPDSANSVQLQLETE